MKRFFTLFLALLSVMPLWSQKVGLVLGGGGAKGMAHIGVIKVLEDHNIPIDYVAGTSIGAIVAGLYASGYSPEEMYDLFNSDEFRLWSTGKLDKDDLYYFKGKDESPIWANVDITKRKDRIKVLLPLGLIPERQMDFAFMKLMSAASAACNNNFDSLMVPFRCISSDIYNNKEIVHRDGDFGDAIRASMTFPVAFKPIEFDGVLHYDGGIMNNFPTDVMQKDFKPDIIIGHKVSDDQGVPDNDDLFAQIEAMVMQITDYSIPDSVGILMETRLTDVNLFDFPKVAYTSRRGIETALSFIDSIEAKIPRRVSPEEVKAKREAFKAKKPDLIFNNVQVEGLSNNQQRKFIIQSFKGKNKTFDLESFHSSYFKTIADDNIKSIRPVTTYNKSTGYFDVNLKVEPRKPFDIGFGGMLSSRPNTFGFFEAKYKMFRRQSFSYSTNLYFGRFYNSFQIGGRMDMPSKRPFYLSSYFTLNSWNYYSTSSDIIFADSDPSYAIQNEQNFRIEGGIPFSRTGVIDMGISWASSTDQYFQSSVFNRSDTFDKTSFNATTAYLQIDQKNYDSKQFATEGDRRFFEFRYIYGNEKFLPGTLSPITDESRNSHSYIQMKGIIDHYFKLKGKWSLGLCGEAVVTNKGLFSNYTATMLNAPAFMPTPNSKTLYIEQFRSNQYFAAGGKLIYQINDTFHFRGEIYGFVPFKRIIPGENKIPEYKEEAFTDLHPMGLIAGVMKTPIGPLSIEANYYQKNGQKWFFSASLGYMIFNKRGF